MKVGQQYMSAVCDTKIVVVRAPSGPATITCGGAPMFEAKSIPEPGAQADEQQMDGTQLGKRYSDEGVGLQVLCVMPGNGSLAVDGIALEVDGVKHLPSSD